MMRGSSLDSTLTVTGPDDKVLVSPHYRDATDDRDPGVRERAIKTDGNAYFVRDKIRTGPTVETALVVQAAHLSREGVATRSRSSAGRRVWDRHPRGAAPAGRVDARIVRPDGPGAVARRRQRLDRSSRRIRRSRSRCSAPMARSSRCVEVAVSDGNLDQVLRNITLTSALLALGALGAVVLIGLLVARRTARDLDRLVEGSLAAARGDLEHRVPVRSKDEIGAVAAAFNFMMEDLKTSKEKLVIAERIAAWQEIARRLAHEIKNPLTPIQMAMDTLRKTWKIQHPSFAEILEESTTTVLEEADRLKHIVAEFSDFARMPKPELRAHRSQRGRALGH